MARPTQKRCGPISLVSAPNGISQVWLAPNRGDDRRARQDGWVEDTYDRYLTQQQPGGTGGVLRRLTGPTADGSAPAFVHSVTLLAVPYRTVTNIRSPHGRQMALGHYPRVPPDRPRLRLVRRAALLARHGMRRPTVNCHRPVRRRESQLVSGVCAARAVPGGSLVPASGRLRRRIARAAVVSQPHDRPAASRPRRAQVPCTTRRWVRRELVCVCARACA